MNEDLLKAFSPSSQRALRLLAASPQDAADFHNRLTLYRAALRIGLEVIESQIPGDATGATKTAAMATLGSCTAIECTMNVLENLHPELGKANASRPPSEHERRPTNPDYIAQRFKGLDLD